MKVYLSRSQSRAWATHEGSVGDPVGGAAYGEFNDPMTVMGGASLIGGLAQASAAGDAADAQAGAAARSDATQRYMYDTTREDNKPFRDAGVSANNRLSYLLGLGTAGSPGTSQQFTADQFRNQLLPQYTKTSTPATPPANSALAAFLASTDGRYDSSYAPAPTPTIDEAGLSAAIQQRMDEQARQAAAQQTAAQSDPQYGSLLRNFSASDLRSDPVLNADPSYMTPMHDFGQADLNNDLVYQNGLQFGLNEGEKGINQIAAASGSMLSGATLKALAKYGNDYGTTKTADAYNRFTQNQNAKYGMRNDSFNRFNTTQDRTYNKLAGVSGAGQQATNQVSAAGQNMANNISQSQQGVGNARAASSIGQSNALVNGLNQGVSAWNNRGGSAGNWPGNFLEGATNQTDNFNQYGWNYSP